MHDPIYVKIHRYDKDYVSPDGFSVAKLEWDASGYGDMDATKNLAQYERTEVHGIFNRDKCEEFLAELNLDPGVPYGHILVGREVRDYVLNNVLPLEWRALDTETLDRRVTFFFLAPDAPVVETKQAESVEPQMLAFIESIAKKGIGCDLRPTMAFGGTEKQMYARFCEYMETVDGNLKEAAGRLLEQLAK